MEISAESILENRAMIRQIWIDNFTKPIDIIEYRSCDEGLSSLYLFICSKDLFSEFFIALMVIWLKAIYVREEWKDLTISNEVIDAIIDN